MDSAFWKGRKVLVTGHTGFKGSWLSVWLHQLGAQVFGLALHPDSTPNLFDLANVQRRTESRIGDVRDANVVKSAVATWQPDVVFHLAAQSLVHRGYRLPLETFETNVIGTANVLEAVRAVDSVQAVVIVTTDKVYANEERNQAFQEDDRLGGKDPYSSSKACAELVTASYRDSYLSSTSGSEHPVPVATARAGNVIGGGDWSEDRLIPDLVRAAAVDRAIDIRRPEATRPWQHVLEPLGGYLMLAQRLIEDGEIHARAWNFGPVDEDTRSVRWVLERMIALWDDRLEWRMDDTVHPPEASTLRLDCTRAAQDLGWRPAMRLSEALEWLVEWHLTHLRGGNVSELTEGQIERYQAAWLARRQEPSETT